MAARGRIAGIMAALLATAATTVSWPAVADDNGTVVARAAVRGRPVVVGALHVRSVPMAVVDQGKTLIAVTTAGISKYAVTRHSVRLKGRNPAKATEGKRLNLEVPPDGRFAYLTSGPQYGPEVSRLLVFDLRKARPRLVRTLRFPKLGRIHDTAITPDGTRLFLRAYEKLKVLDLGRPARPRKQPTISEPDGYGPVEVTPDGTHLVTALTSSTRGAGDPVHVWDISQSGAPVIEREGTVRLPGDDTASWIDELAISPRGDELYVKSGYCTDECEDSYTETTRVRLSDLTAEAQTSGIGSRYEFLEAVSGDGGKVFMRWQDRYRTGSMVWLDPDLSTAQHVVRVGNVRGSALSQQGKTRGTLYVAGRKSGKLHLFAVRF